MFYEFSRDKKKTISAEQMDFWLRWVANFILNSKNYLQIRLCHRNNMRTLIRTHLYEPIRKKIQILIYQDIFTYISQVYRRYVFYRDGL